MENEIAVVEQPQQQGLMIFGTASPGGIITKATAIADALAPLIEKKKLYVTVGGRKHVYVEGWNTMLAMLGVFPSVEYSRRIGDTPIAYESRVTLKHVSGTIVGAGEALCTADEKNWAAKDEFQLKSMSQTRATGKAARLSFSWIMGLAGYEATPAEEVDGDDPPREPIKEPQRKSEAVQTDILTAEFIPADHNVKSGEKDGKPWTKHGIKDQSGKWYGTFDEATGEILAQAAGGRRKVSIAYTTDGKYQTIRKAILA